jgi:tetratricopeptide (TPR) repeat protein
MSKKRPRVNPIASRGARIGVCIFLVAVTWLVFGQTLWHGFINYDDPVYVYENPVVASGLTLHGIGWAFTQSHGANWHPLTWISHMLDCQFYGLKAGGHHFSNVLLHSIAVLLLFLLFWQMTGALWRSGFVAVVFAIHPLHVESVAWVAERKDVLSGIFFMLTLMAYVRYARRPSLARYATVLVLFGCGLMAKPMLVTIPFVLLLLDYWPLGRFAQSYSIRLKAVRWHLVLEKVPLLALSVASCIATFIAQRGAINSFEQLPLAPRINNALVSCLTYIWQLIWPVNLTVFYLHPSYQLPFLEIALAALLLIAITMVAVALFRKYPYFITGWLWYLVMLVPVIGVIQVGSQAHADRYTYLPQIGLYLLGTWTITDLSVSWRYQRQILGVAAALVIAALAFRTWNQTSYWHDSESLWTHALAVNSDNDIAHSHLGNAALRKGRIDEAILHFQRVLEIYQVHNESGTHDPFANLVRPEAESDLGNALLRKGQIDEAIGHLQKAVELNSHNVVAAESHLGYALLQEGRVEESFAHLQRALEINPAYAPAHFNLANTLLQMGRVDEAVSHLQKVLTTDPNDPEAQKNMAWVLATWPEARIRDGAKAVELAERANQLTESRDPVIGATLAAAYAETGRFPDAIRTAEAALQLATDSGNVALAKEIRAHIARYRSGHPFRDIR